ncbi:MAG: hypothetical protein AAGA75_08675 [Cyanobacteria bacterium P01_E01_bin.6]
MLRGLLGRLNHAHLIKHAQESTFNEYSRRNHLTADIVIMAVIQ